MMSSVSYFVRVLFLLGLVIVPTLLPLQSATAQEQEAPATKPTDEEMAKRVATLVKQLDADTLAERDQAEKELLEVGSTVLPLLPKINANTSAETRVRLQRIQDALQDKFVDEAVEASTVTLQGSHNVHAALAAITEQTGNKITFDDIPDTTVELDFEAVPFWEAFDELLDLASLQVQPFRSDGGSVVVSARDQTDGLRIERAAYAGVFRLEPVELTASRRMRSGATNSLNIQMWVSWEPRLSPIFVQFKMDSFEAILDNGETLAVSNPAESPEYSPTTSACQMEIDLSLNLPDRAIRAIKSIKGTFVSALPGKIVELEFDQLAAPGKKVKEMGSLSVVLEKVRKNGATNEFQTRIKLANAGRTMDSFRGWVLGNEAYLLDDKDQRYENAGSSTTSVAGNEVGISYLFVLEKDIKNYRFIYKAPASVLEQSYTFELSDLPLP
jgi:hypothetical protein